jgi:hypothetical protein
VPFRSSDEGAPDEPELMSGMWFLSQDYKFRMLAQADIVSGILTCVILLSFFIFMVISVYLESVLSKTLELNPKTLSSIFLGWFSLIPFKN